MALSSMRCVAIFRTIKTETFAGISVLTNFTTTTNTGRNERETGPRSFDIYSKEGRDTHRMEESGTKVMFVGLGNLDMPGTRHSVGMQFIDRMARILDVKLKKKKECLGLVASTNISGVEVIMLKPKPAMNLNGTSVHKTVRHYGVDTSNVYVLHDDLDRAVGKLSIKESGSAGGHNGVKSTINSLKTDAFPRLRIGIDRPSSINMVSKYVMGKFTPEEQALIEKSVSKGIGQLCRHVENKTSVNIGPAFRKQSEGDGG